MKALLLLILSLSPGVHAEEPASAAVAAPLQDEDAGKPLSEPPLGPPPGPDEVRERTDALSSELRCPVCQGLSVGASPSEAARAMRERIRELVGLGYGDQQIVDYFVGRYGTWVLLEPPKEGFSWVLWLAPAVAVGGGLLLLALRARKGAQPAAAPAPAPMHTETDPYRAAVLAELGDIGPASKEERSS